jgi:hypothetical protein
MNDHTINGHVLTAGTGQPPAVAIKLYCSIDLPTGTGICPTLCPQNGQGASAGVGASQVLVPCEW